MTRCVVVGYGSRGDLEPVVALAGQLRRAGAEVVGCGPPDLGGLFDQVGAGWVPFGRAVRELAVGAAAGRGPRSLPEVAGELMDGAHRAVLTAGPCDLVVAAGSLPGVVGAQSAAEVTGAGYRYATTSPCYLPSPRHAPVPWPGQQAVPQEAGHRHRWEANAEHLQGLLGPAADAHRSAVGLPGTRRLRDHVIAGGPLLAADPLLWPWPTPSDLDVVQTGAWTRTDERALPPELEDFLAAGDAPVFAGFGSMPLPGAAARLAGAALDAARAVGRRLVLSSGWAGLRAPEGAEDCYLVGEVNQQALFGRVTVVVHHGGAGTTTTAARAGAPQVVLPQVADQPSWAARVAALGLGAAHPGPVPTPASMTAALQTALTPTVAARAQQVAHQVHDDGAARAAAAVLGTSAR